MLTIVIMPTCLSISLISQNTRLTKTTRGNSYKNSQIKIECSTSHASLIPPHCHTSYSSYFLGSNVAPRPMSKLNINQWWQHSQTIRKLHQTQISGSSLVKRTPSAGQGLDLYFPSPSQIPLPDNCIPPPLTCSLCLLIPEWMWICFFNNIRNIIKINIGGQHWMWFIKKTKHDHNYIPSPFCY